MTCGFVYAIRSKVARIALIKGMEATHYGYESHSGKRGDGYTCIART